MTEPPAALLSRVEGIEGSWPGPPEFWSHSSLREAEECPRRWALARGMYPGVWDKPGYPPRPVMPAIVGDIIHGSLDQILGTLHEFGCSSLSDPAAAGAMKSLGGYTAIIDRLIERHVEFFELNPRTASRAPTLRATLQSKVPDIRQRVQMMVARANLMPGTASPAVHAEPGERMPLPDGSHPEITLRSAELRLVGRADLITIAGGSCSIVDYKTGVEHEHHAEQLRLYALIWMHDSELNPQGIPVEALTLSYAHRDVEVPPLDDSQLGLLAAELSARVEVAESEITATPPPARPSLEVCRLCGVRHLCEEYWASPHLRSAMGEFADREGMILSQNGPRSWTLDTTSTSERVLLRTPTEVPGFKIGDRIRLLDVVTAIDEDSGTELVTVTKASEVYLLKDDD